MSGRMVQLSEVLSTLGDGLDVSGKTKARAERFEFWLGASGRAYVHSVYQLVDCPELPACNYVLVTRDVDGRAHAAKVGQTTAPSRSLNRAAVRQLASNLGASEVHVHYLGENHTARARIAFDLETAEELRTVAETEAANADLTRDEFDGLADQAPRSLN